MMAMVERAAPPGDVQDCPECGGDVQTVRGETVCGGCGLVVDEQQLDHGRGSRFGEQRHGPPGTPTRHDRGLGTDSLGWNDAQGRNVSSARLSRMRTQQHRARFESSAERNRMVAFIEARRIATGLGHGMTVVDGSCDLLRRAQDRRLFLGRSIESVAAASVYAVLRMLGRPVALRDILPHTAVTDEAMRNAYAALNRGLDLPTPPPKVADRVPRIASAIDLCDEHRVAAESLARAVDETTVLQGRNPDGAAAACIFAVAGVDVRAVTKTELADVTGVVTATIRNGHERLQESDEVDLDEYTA